MPHFICRWPGGDVLLASVESRQELDAILQERCEPGVCKVARYHGPLVLELKPDIPGAPHASAERFKLGPACPAFAAAWQTRLSTADTDLLAADGSRQRVHRLVLQCRLPVLGGQPLVTGNDQVRLQVVPDSRCLSSLVKFLYLDDVQQQAISHSLYVAALHCGLERLVTCCEAHFAHQLEVQLHSWPGLSEAQREGVLDSFIGWARFAEQQDRGEMLQLCVHSLALHCAAAQSRPAWSALASQTVSQVRLVAASTAPPIIHRQVLPNGSAILPVLANPGPDHTNPPAAPGQPPAAPASVVSVDAEAFAAAGGRMTSWEWQQLQRFRDAVTECRSMPDASPLVLQAEQLASHSLTTGEPGVSFGVKQAVLTPHRRLMDSVCRFAFPATHGLLAGGWQMQSAPQAAGNTATTTGPAGQAVAAAAQGSGPVQSVQQAHPAAAEHTRQQHHQQQGMLLPVPVPAVQQLSDHLAAVAQNRTELIQTVSTVEGGSDHGSSGGCLQPHSSQPAPAPAAVPAAGNWPADPALQLRAQAAAGAAAVAVGQQSGRASEHRQSWGSAAGADPQQAGQPQQQSWGTAVAGPESIPASHVEASTASGLSMGGVLQLTGIAGPPPSCVQQAATAAGQGQAAQQAGASTDEVHRLRHWRPDGASSDGQQAGASIQQSTLERQHQQQHMLEGAGSIPAAPATASILDLPALWQPSSSSGRRLAAGSCAGAGEGVPAAAAALQQQQKQAPGTATTADSIDARGSSTNSAGGQAIAALQRALVEDFVLYEEASAARQHVVGILVAVEQGDAAAGQRLLAPACAELIAATAPAAVPNRLAPFLSSPAVASAAANARAAGAGPAEVASAAAVAAAEEYCRHVQGITRLLGSASSSRAALEASPGQVRQLRQQQQALLVRALQRVSNRVPWLSRLLTPLQQSLGPDGTHGQAAAPVAASSEAAEAQQDGQAGLRRAGEQQAGAAQGQQTQEALVEPPALHLTSPAEVDAGQHELQAAVVELIMQLPELLHGLPGPALLTYEQYRQRYTQAQQLAAHAMQLLLPGEGQEEGAAAASSADGVAAELAASGLLAAASAAMAASQAPPSAADPGSTTAPGQHQTSAGHLFANILDSLRGPGAGVMAEHAAGTPGAAGGFLSRTAAFAAANRLADGLIRPAPVMPPSSLGLSRAGSLAGAGQLGAWRLPAGAAGSSASTGGFMTPAGGAAAAAGAAGLGMFAPTGTGALLSGGLLAEGGVAGDSILDDVLHGNVRRITCHGLYELCAALAQPAGGVSSPPTAAQQQPQQSQGGGEAGCEGAPAAQSQMETDDSDHSSEGRLTVQHVAEAVVTVAAAAVAVESNRRSSSTHSMRPPAPPGGLAGCKRRLSSAQEEQAQLERPLKH